jgi:hypothetical protein
MKRGRMHNKRTRSLWTMLFLLTLCCASESQDRENQSHAQGCTAQIQSLRITRLRAPQILSRLVEKSEVVVPEYAGRGTAVTLEVVIGSEGRVSCIDHVRGHALMTGPAVEAVSKWHFKPLVRAGTSQPEPFYGDLTVAIRGNVKDGGDRGRGGQGNKSGDNKSGERIRGQTVHSPSLELRSKDQAVLPGIR